VAAAWRAAAGAEPPPPPPPPPRGELEAAFGGQFADAGLCGDAVALRCGYGSFHIDYFLGGVLIAVSVVDVLPRGLSSVYAFYDPQLRALELGKVTALFEIEFARRARLNFYYLGLYIQRCPKMRYKADFSPAELLCPATWAWVPLDDAARAALDADAAAALEPAARADAAVAAAARARRARAADAAADAAVLLLTRPRGPAVLTSLAGLAAAPPAARASLRAALAALFARTAPDFAQRVVVEL
jgi:hypothetical protein